MMTLLISRLSRHVSHRPYTTVSGLKSNLLRRSNEWVAPMSNLHTIKPKFDRMDSFINHLSKDQLLQILSSRDTEKHILKNHDLHYEESVPLILSNKVLYTKAVNELFSNKSVKIIRNEKSHINAVMTIFENYKKLLGNYKQLAVNELYNLNLLCEILISYYQITKAYEIIKYIFKHNSIFDVATISNYMKLRSGSDYKTWYKPFYQFTDNNTPIRLLDRLQNAKFHGNKLLINEVLLSLGYFNRKDLLLETIKLFWGIDLEENSANKSNGLFEENDSHLLYPTPEILLNIYRSMTRLKNDPHDESHINMLIKFLIKYPNVKLTNHFWSDILNITIYNAKKDTKSDEQLIKVYYIFKNWHEINKSKIRLDCAFFDQLLFVLKQNSNLTMVQNVLTDLLSEYAITANNTLKGCIQRYQKYLTVNIVHSTKTPGKFDEFVNSYSFNTQNKLSLVALKDDLISKRLAKRNIRKSKEIIIEKSKQLEEEEEEGNGVIDSFW